MVDRGGSFTYSRILPFTLKFVENNFSIYPNPAMNEIFISLTTGKNERARIRIADVSGKIWIDQQKEIQQGTTVFPLNTSNLKAGQYIIQVLVNGDTEASKFTVIN